MIVNGYTLVFHQALVDQLVKLVEAADSDRNASRHGRGGTSAAALLDAASWLMLDAIPSDPTRRKYRPRGTASEEYDLWLCASLSRGYRLFFRLDSPRRRIVYAWLHSPTPLPGATGRPDPYRVFVRMLASGSPPETWASLMRCVRTLPKRSARSLAASREHDGFGAGARPRREKSTPAPSKM
jgi:toxin YhaV